MPLPRQILGTPACELATEWGIDPRLAQLLILLVQVSIPLVPEHRRRDVAAMKIISGFRTREAQQQLGEAGRPTAPDHLSTHRSCPATGADLRVSPGNTKEIWSIIGPAAESIGLRWGGGSPRTDGIPADFNHVDLGRRLSI